MVHFLGPPATKLNTGVIGAFVRNVKGCRVSEAVSLQKPHVVLQTTNMLAIRWETEAVSVAEAKRVTRYEVQWRQVPSSSPFSIGESSGPGLGARRMTKRPDQILLQSSVVEHQKERVVTRHDGAFDVARREEGGTRAGEKEMGEEEEEEEEEEDPGRDMIEAWSLYEVREKKRDIRRGKGKRRTTIANSAVSPNGREGIEKDLEETGWRVGVGEGKDKFAGEIQPQPGPTRTEKMYFMCDYEFCTIPTRVVTRHDNRGEILIHGLWPFCPQLQFRVRAKCRSGWSQWSPYSDPVRTLDDEIDAPRGEMRMAHRIKLSWKTPFEEDEAKIGKVQSSFSPPFSITQRSCLISLFASFSRAFKLHLF